jgi:pimeloyl-ACP methyl ester carboxylesterase
MRFSTAVALVALPLATLGACGDDSPATPDVADTAAPDATSDTTDPADTPETADTTPPPACDPTRPPVVMAHGFLAAGDTWTPFAQRFLANGDCPDRLFAFDWNPFDRDAAPAQLETFIDAVRTATGATTVQLVGHSAGGNLGYTFLADPARAARVSHYAHVGSGSDKEGPAGPTDAPVPTLNLYSRADRVVPGADIPGAINAGFDGFDHYQIATAPEAFARLFEHFRGAPPTTTDRTAAPPANPGRRRIHGRALTIGENAPVAGWTVDIYPVQPETGVRTTRSALGTFTVAADGSFGPIDLEPDTHHEFHLYGGGPDDRAVHYFREPFAADDPFVVLRALPGPDSLAGLLFSNIPFPEDSPVVIAFTASQAVIAGRDTLTVAGEDLAVEGLATPEKTAIAWFFYDQDEDQTSGEGATEIPLFSSFGAFLVALDRYFPADAEGPIVLSFNGRELRVPRIPAASGGATVAIFD